MKRISRARPQFQAEVSWFLLHGNGRSHSALVVKTLLARHSVVEINNPRSSDLTPADFFSFLQRPPSKERGVWMLNTLRKT
jgi:hypothetical protein